MASIGLFSPGVDCSMTMSLRQNMPRKCVEVEPLRNLVLSRRISLSSGRLLVKPHHLRAVTEEIGGGELDDESNDSLQITIEKSTKLLEKQSNLLEKIAERNKVVSSIKSIIIDIEELEQPISDNHFTISSLDSTAGEVVADDKEHGKDIPVNGASSAISSDLQPKEVESVSLKSNGIPNGEPSSDNESPVEWEDIAEPISITAVETDSKQIPMEVNYESLPDKEHELPEELKAENADETLQDQRNEDVKPPPLAGANVMNVILVACECSPWIKTGGLGDVAGALPKALARRGHRVMVIVPRYSNYANAQDTGVRKRYKVDGQDMEMNYFHAYIDGVDFVFLDSPNFCHLDKNNIYGGNRVDILKRMVLFCKAAVEVPWHVPCGGICYGDSNLVFIANDWHTALLPVYLKAYYRDHGLMQYARAVLVIHNIAHQGRGPVDEFRIMDLPHHYLDQFKLYDPVGGEHMNIFAAGIKTADRVVTVSHGYAWEIKTPEGGWGLHGIINENDWKLQGIVNGIDTNDWSPERDTHLQSDGYINYSLDTLISGKAQCKEALQREMGLTVCPDVPLIGFIGRLDHQKGVDLIAEAVPWMMSQNVQLIMLGTGRHDLEEMLRHFEGQYRDKIRGYVGFSVKTAHRITAGADIILMPSRFEPCGLNQLYAMRYGTIPVVHGVGGLRDTVIPFNPFEETGYGWTFCRADVSEVINALGNCFLTFREYKMSWKGLQRRGMMQDLSWDHAAELYEQVLVAAKYQW